MMAAHNKVEASQDIVKNKQRSLDADSSTKAAALFEKGEEAVSNALSMISLQSLIVLLRNPQVKAATSQRREWLSEVAAQYNERGCRLLVVTQ